MDMQRIGVLGVCTVLAVLAVAPIGAVAADNPYLAQFEERVTEFTLDNGLQFLVIERDNAPVASFVTLVDVGSASEPTGKTGMAHLIEHLAFKGTPRIGTTDWEQEQQALQRLDQAYQDWQAYKDRDNPDPERLEEKRESFEKWQKRAGEYVQGNAFAKILEKNGGTDLNAATSADITQYYCSLPANKAELWFSLEADRLQNPVWREFYTEKQVVLEERRMRVDTNPNGKLLERLLATSYLSHPYGQPVIGWRSDIEQLRKADLEAFYSTYYVPQNMTIAVAGDVQPEQIKAWAQQYFGPMPAGPEPPELTVQEPPQEGRRLVEIPSPNRPVLAQSFHTVPQGHADYLALELLGDILAKGRTSRLYAELVEKRQLAAHIFAFNGYPGVQYTPLFMVFAIPNAETSLAKVEEGIAEVIKTVREKGVTQEELQRAKAKMRAGVIRDLDSNLGLAKSFAEAEVLRGQWQRVFTRLSDLEQVGVETIQEVAQEYLQPDRSTTGKLQFEQEESARDSLP